MKRYIRSSNVHWVTARLQQESAVIRNIVEAVSAELPTLQMRVEGGGIAGWIEFNSYADEPKNILLTKEQADELVAMLHDITAQLGYEDICKISIDDSAAGYVRMECREDRSLNRQAKYRVELIVSVEDFNK